MPPNTLAGLSLRDLEYAVTVAELRHFGRAAERCGVSQPALSEQIRKLEGLLGVTLFERSSRRIEPTAQATNLLRQAEVVIREARGLLEMAKGEAEPLTGPLRLGVIATLGPYYVPWLLPDMRARYPGLSLRLQEGRTGELLERCNAARSTWRWSPCLPARRASRKRRSSSSPSSLPARRDTRCWSRSGSASRIWTARGCCCWKKGTACGNRRSPSAMSPPGCVRRASPARWKCCAT